MSSDGDHSKSVKKASIALLCSLLLMVLLQSLALFLYLKDNAVRDAEERADAIARNLALALGDPLAMGEYDHMQQLSESVMVTNSNIKSIIVLSNDGRCLVTSDPAKRSDNAYGSDFDKQSLAITAPTRRAEPAGGTEMVVPVKAAGAQAAVLRVSVVYGALQDILVPVAIFFCASAAVAAVIALTIFSSLKKGV